MDPFFRPYSWRIADNLSDQQVSQAANHFFLAALDAAVAFLGKLGTAAAILSCG
jgi:hypothetical protein